MGGGGCLPWPGAQVAGFQGSKWVRAREPEVWLVSVLLTNLRCGIRQASWLLCTLSFHV